MKRKILVIDIGGTRVKLLMSPRNEREFPSGPRMGPAEFVDRFKQNVRGWNFDVVSIGFPAPVRNGRITRDSGKTATVASDVWIRPCVSVLGTRWTRCPPDSKRRCW